MSITGPDFLALQVRALHVSAAFYEEHLGLTRGPQGSGVALVFATEPIPFAVREPLVDPDGYRIVMHDG